jgi:7-cyano-7-deazaguanine synthase in queuosine biosynthesis
MNKVNSLRSHHTTDQEKPVNLLWTGGWDSTFRLLQLLLEEKATVQPYYIIDYRRSSIGKEFETMRYLRKKITDTYPEALELFLPTIHSEMELIKPDKQITDSYKKIIKYRHLGDQYDWLTRFCKQLNIGKFELAIEKHLHYGYLSLSPYLCSVDDYPNFSKPDYYDIVKPELIFLLSFFDMPLKNTTKLMMLHHARKKGWLNGIMNKTWFCYQPTRLNSPCGLCKPCSQAMENRFGWRIPLHRRGLYYLRKWKRSIF